MADNSPARSWLSACMISAFPCIGCSAHFPGKSVIKPEDSPLHKSGSGRPASLDFVAPKRFLPACEVRPLLAAASFQRGRILPRISGARGYWAAFQASDAPLTASQPPASCSASRHNIPHRGSGALRAEVSQRRRVNHRMGGGALGAESPVEWVRPSRRKSRDPIAIV